MKHVEQKCEKQAYLLSLEAQQFTFLISPTFPDTAVKAPLCGFTHGYVLGFFSLLLISAERQILITMDRATEPR